jgi:hypothetical protein
MPPALLLYVLAGVLVVAGSVRLALATLGKHPRTMSFNAADDLIAGLIQTTTAVALLMAAGSAA